MKNWKLGLMTLAAYGFMMQGCSKEEPDNPNEVLPSEYTKLNFIFTPTVNGVPLNASDTIIYENLSGNFYSVNNLKFLISDVRLNDWEYNNHQLGEYHLVDMSDPTTLEWKVKDTIKAKDIASISLFLGFRDGENKTGQYPDLDEVGWGAPLKVTGYYTFRMDGHYLSDINDTSEDPYAMDLCSRKLVETQTDTSFQPNELVASLPNSGFPISRGTAFVVVEIRFDVNMMFQSATGDANYNLDNFTSNTIDDTEATSILNLNIIPAFSMGSVGYNSKPKGL